MSPTVADATAAFRERMIGDDGAGQCSVQPGNSGGNVCQYGRWRMVPMGWVYGDRPATRENIVSLETVFNEYEAECSRLEEQLKSMVQQRNELRDIHERQHQRIIDLEKNDETFRKVVDKLTADNHGMIPGWLLGLAP